MIKRISLSFLCLSLLISGLLGRGFHDLTYEVLENEAKELAGEFALVQSPNELYHLPKARSKDGFECSPSIIRVTQTNNIYADKRRPQIIISGEIHGDERVGPASTLHIAQLLVWSANCEIHRLASYCQKLQEFSNISKGQRLWMALLATKRDSFLIPTGNCLGHKFRRRDDNFIDPNRDFPYSRSNNACLMSTTAKIFEKIMSNNIIQMVVTFHGGMVALGYEWGSKNHPAPNDSSPDDSANKQLATLFSEYGGTAGSGESQYKVNRINSIVYSVDGGMEDWMYAAGWDKSLVRMDCIGNKKKKRFLRTEDVNTSSLLSLSGNRALVFLVETSDAKSPPDAKLGGSDEVLHSNGKENGHIPRNIRLGLMSIDLVEPYICFSQVQLFSASSSPSNISDTSFSQQPAINLTSPAQAFLRMRWYIGGARVVDKTFLTLSRAPSSGVSPFTIASQGYFDLLPSDDVLDELVASKSVVNGVGINDSSSTIGLSFGRNRHSPRLISPIFSGGSRWHPSEIKDESHVSLEYEDTTVFDESDPLRPSSEYYLSVNLSRLFSHRRRKLSDPMSFGTMGSFASSFFASPEAHNEEKNENGKFHQLPTADIMAAAVSGMHERKLQPATQPRRNLGSLFSSSASSQASSSLKGKYWILAWATVDQEYGLAGQGQPAELGPMSYYANIRTKSETRCETTGPEQRTCRGRRYWPSDFIELDVLEDGTIAHMRYVLHCASWSMPQSGISATNLVSSKQDRNDTTAPEEPLHKQYLNKSPSAIFQSDVAESYSLEKSYTFLMVVLFITVFVAWHLSACWKRSRIYASVMSNKYLNLPTGFRSRKPQSPGLLSLPSSQTSFSLSATSASAPPSPAPTPQSFVSIPSAESISVMTV